MNYTITLKECNLTERDREKLHLFTSKLANRLSNFVIDLPMLEVILHKSQKKGGYFEGTLKLNLPKKPIVAHEKGITIEDAMHNGFYCLLKEFEKYKGKHFKGSSKYPNHDTIRARGWYE